jgi:hypothetical protein
MSRAARALGKKPWQRPEKRVKSHDYTEVPAV